MDLPLLYSLFHPWVITLKYRAPEKMASREDMIPQHILWVTLQEGEINFFKSLRSNENGSKSQWNAGPGLSYKRGRWVCFIFQVSGAHRDLKWPLKIMQNVQNEYALVFLLVNLLLFHCPLISCLNLPAPSVSLNSEIAKPTDLTSGWSSLTY